MAEIEGLARDHWPKELLGIFSKEPQNPPRTIPHGLEGIAEQTFVEERQNMPTDKNKRFGLFEANQTGQQEIPVKMYGFIKMHNLARWGTWKGAPATAARAMLRLEIEAKGCWDAFTPQLLLLQNIRKHVSEVLGGEDDFERGDTVHFQHIIFRKAAPGDKSVPDQIKRGEDPTGKLKRLAGVWKLNPRPDLFKLDDNDERVPTTAVSFNENDFVEVIARPEIYYKNSFGHGPCRIRIVLALDSVTRLFTHFHTLNLRLAATELGEPVEDRDHDKINDSDNYNLIAFYQQQIMTYVTLIDSFYRLAGKSCREFRSSTFALELIGHLRCLCADGHWNDIENQAAWVALCQISFQYFLCNTDATYADNMIRLQSELAIAADLASRVLQREAVKLVASRSNCIRRATTMSVRPSPGTNNKAKDRQAMCQNMVDQELTKRKQEAHSWEDLVDPHPYPTLPVSSNSSRRLDRHQYHRTRTRMAHLTMLAVFMSGVVDAGCLTDAFHNISRHRPSALQLSDNEDSMDIETRRRLEEWRRFDDDDRPIFSPSGPEEHDRKLIDDLRNHTYPVAAAS
ncbi:hypothetical protein NM688_g5733 [Phlebia brevispora]|uniref:Uncharacterized protein n=1 Tax=Phlebia brevispora TaxID=194682 RepID=A0ACC1SQR9_9APHY|nr:hypothetical protein NM688_g5733 [Phlebia brevispora]